MILTLSLRPISSQRTVFEKDRQWPRLRLTANPSAFTMFERKTFLELFITHSRLITL